jgi:hypothetical protein
MYPGFEWTPQQRGRWSWPQRKLHSRELQLCLSTKSQEYLWQAGAMADPEDESVQVPVVWVGLDDQPVLMANQFIGQVEQDEIVISIGSQVPPPIVGPTAEERREQLLRIAFVPVRPIVRFSMTPRRVEELAHILRDTLENYERRYGAGGTG